MSSFEFWTMVYFVGMIVSWPICSYTFLRMEDERDNDAIFSSIMMGACFCFMWPLFLPGYWIWVWLKGLVDEPHKD